ncbi:hypothetical protein DOY81_013270 [Sarcophaga bullata]|nr:hypothetical protein DOY81_013270 [Sarcophaga bullata]
MGKNYQDGSSSDSSDEKSSPTAASRSCSHVKRAVDSAKLRKLLKTTGLLLDCEQCLNSAVASPAVEACEKPDSPGGFEYDNTLWLCLKCGSQLCGRSKNQHALLHYKTPRSDCHALTLNTRSFEIWCYECDNEVKADSRKNLLECVEFVKGLAQKPPVAAPLENIENKIISTFESLRPLVPVGEANNSAVDGNKTAIPLPPIPGMAKRINEPLVTYGNCNSLPLISTVLANVNNKSAATEQLPRVRGLTNLGNTCFFNAVMQCLAQTPYLLDVLRESAEPGEEFTLPGGTFKSKDDEVLNLPPIKGTLSAWGSLTSALAQTLEELQSGGGVFNPSKLFNKLCASAPNSKVVINMTLTNY